MHKFDYFKLLISIIFFISGCYLLHVGYKDPFNIVSIFSGSWISVVSLLQIAVTICDINE